MKNTKYIQNKNLDGFSIEQLVQSGVWRTIKNKKYKYQYLSEMDSNHLENAINIFMGTNNYVVLGALRNELERRINLANQEKQKIIETKKEMKNETQMELINMMDTSVTDAATDVARVVNESTTSKNPLDRIINPYPQVFKQGETVENKYCIVEVNSRNRRGYTYVIKDISTNATVEVSQSNFLKILGRAAAENTRKKSSAKIKTILNETAPQIPQKYNIGDLVGKYKILGCIRGKYGKRGWAYNVENIKTGKKSKLKQSLLNGVHVPNGESINTPTKQSSVKKVTKASKETNKKLSFLNRLKTAWNIITQ
jgi:hypothetical protein